MYDTMPEQGTKETVAEALYEESKKNAAFIEPTSTPFCVITFVECIAEWFKCCESIVDQSFYESAISKSVCRMGNSTRTGYLWKYLWNEWIALLSS